MAIALLVGACATGVPADNALRDELEPLLESQGSTRLADLATYDWDRVYLFTPYTPATEVNDTVGAKVLEDWQWVPESEDLLVFVLHGRPVRLAHTAALMLAADRRHLDEGWSRDVLLEARCRYLYLHEPGENAGPEDCSG